MPPETTAEIKGVGALEIKNEQLGEVEAVIATLDVVDKDGDVIRAGAIKNGAKVKMSGYGHDIIFGEMPVGKGALAIEGDKAIFRGRVFLATTKGREVFEVLKEFGSDQEWSFGFRVVSDEAPSDEWRERGARRVLKKLDAFEVSPVLEGAGRGTRTLGVKARLTEAKLSEDESLTDRMSAVHEAVHAHNRAIPDGDTETPYWWAREVFDDSVIVEAGKQLFRVEYTVDDEGAVTLGEATEVEIVYQPVAEKATAEKADTKTEELPEATPPEAESPESKGAELELDLDGAGKEGSDGEAPVLSEADRLKADRATKAKTLAAVQEYERVQRTLRKLRVV